MALLIVNDDPQILKMLHQILEHEGYDVNEAPNGNQALRLYWENPADLIITDIIMPEKDGIEIIIKLKRDYPDVKIIAISGGGRIDSELYLDMAKKLGVQRTFAKPVERKQLLNAVRDILQ
jgi:YesN/AraC family two-component response regulator